MLSHNWHSLIIHITLQGMYKLENILIYPTLTTLLPIQPYVVGTTDNHIALIIQLSNSIILAKGFTKGFIL